MTTPEQGIGIEQLRDGTDLRDLQYRPPLLKLQPQRFPDFLLMGNAEPRLKVRNQRDSDRCTGYALANLIDLLRIDDGRSTNGEPPQRVSARMLFEMGRLVSMVATGDGQNRLSIRSALKGFYHNGVCPDKNWLDDDPAAQLTVERAKQARQTSLGTYYRIQQYLPDYHAALAEADYILVSAVIHSGWSHEAVRAAGVIEQSDYNTGAHAFVIVGYDANGFYILNSWGEDWGGTAPDGHSVLPGIAHWSYKDWSENIIDAWVLRLGVPLPSSFDYSVGLQGSNYSRTSSGFISGSSYQNGADRSPFATSESISTPRQCVIGHYIHMADGDYVHGGSYPDSEESLRSTLSYLDDMLGTSNAKSNDAQSPAQRIYLRITGDTGDADDAMRRVAILRRRLRPNWYPMSLVWTAGLASAFALAVSACMRDAVARMPDPSDERDDLIESLLRPIGKPLWLRMQQEAEIVARENGPLQLVLSRLNERLDELVYRQGFTDSAYRKGAIELVVEGAGALVFVELLASLDREAPYAMRHIRKIHLACPVVRTDKLARILLRCIRTRDGSAASLLGKIILYAPSESFCKNSTIGAYTRTWLHLVNNSFDAEQIGDRQERIVSLAPDTLSRELRESLHAIEVRSWGRDFPRRSNTSSMLRWHLVSENFVREVIGTPQRTNAAKGSRR